MSFISRIFTAPGSGAAPTPPALAPLAPPPAPPTAPPAPPAPPALAPTTQARAAITGTSLLGAAATAGQTTRKTLLG